MSVVDPPNIATSEAQSIGDQIELNWHFDVAHPCYRPIWFRATLGTDGTVQHVEVLQMYTDAACRAATETARLAVWASSPLRLSPQAYWWTITLDFKAPS